MRSPKGIPILPFQGELLKGGRGYTPARCAGLPYICPSGKYVFVGDYGGE